MSEHAEPTGLDDHPTRPEPSARVRLAELAAAAALEVPDVAGLDAGSTGLFATVGAGRRIAGVQCVVAPGGGFDVALRLVCALVALPPLVDQVRSAVQRAGSEAGLEMASVSVTVADVVSATEARPSAGS